MLRKKPEKSRLNSITRTPSKFATPLFRTTMPMNKQIAAAAKLNSTKNRTNFRNWGHAGISPVIGYTITPRMIGGMSRRGMISKNTLAAKYDNGE